jgi:hypothetical protein
LTDNRNGRRGDEKKKYRELSRATGSLQKDSVAAERRAQLHAVNLTGEHN